MTYGKAIALCKEKRPDVEPIPEFVRQCRKYEAKCRKMGLIRDDTPPRKRKTMAEAPIGPSSGPSIGPSIGPAVGLPAVAEDPAVKKRKKEPVAPPSVDGKYGHCNAAEDAREDPSQVIGPTMPPEDGDRKRSAIGPALPP